MAQEFLSTAGGNTYPDPDTNYDQSEAFRQVALNRDTLDTGLIDKAVLAVLDNPSVMQHRGVAPSGTDWNTLIRGVPLGTQTAEVWYSGDANNTATLENNPVEWPFLLINIVGSATIGAQIAIPYGMFTSYEEGFFYRVTRSSSTVNPWKNLLTSGGGGGGAAPTYGAGSPSLLRIQEFKRAYPKVSTGDKGVVCFRYDHGLTNIKSTLLDMHRAAGIPFYVALNSRLWGDEENSGATQADVRAWMAEGLCEVGNHTSDHRDRDTPDGIYDTIVNGRKELEAQLLTIVHGFTVPGLTEFNKFEGFGTGGMDGYSDTLAGSLILSNHAIVSGALGEVRRPLDGEIQFGMRHYTWEKSSWASIKAQIDAAASTKTALTIMAHPRNMGGAEMFTAALAQQTVTYVKSLIDSGQLANISYYQSHHATL